MSLEQKIARADVKEFTQRPDEKVGQPSGYTLATLKELMKVYKEMGRDVPDHVVALAEKELVVWNEASRLLNSNAEIRLALGDRADAVSTLASMIKQKSDFDAHNALIQDSANFITNVNKLRVGSAFTGSNRLR